MRRSVRAPTAHRVGARGHQEVTRRRAGGGPPVSFDSKFREWPAAGHEDSMSIPRGSSLRVRRPRHPRPWEDPRTEPAPAGRVYTRVPWGKLIIRSGEKTTVLHIIP